MSWEIQPADASYTQQHAIDVGDVPGHQVRIFEVHRRFPNDKPNCEGLKRTKSWLRGSSDYIDLNGSVSGYLTIALENGDKIFARVSATSSDQHHCGGVAEECRDIRGDVHRRHRQVPERQGHSAGNGYLRP